MSQPTKEALRKNIRRYAWYKMLTKRTYLPIIAIYLVEVAHLSLAEIAIIAAVTAAAQLLLQLPGGFFADHFGNKKAMQYSTWFVTISPLFYVIMPNFWGGLIASVLFFGAYAFQQGSAEAFMHDTMVALGEESRYAKVMGRAQSYGLMGNLVLTALIPATYLYDKRLPFILGFVSLLIMSWLIYSFTYPPHRRTSRAHSNPLAIVRTICTRANLLLFLFAGTATAISIAGSQYQELLFKVNTVDPALFGLIASAASLFGALLGVFTHVLTHSISSAAFYLIDLLILSGTLAVAGYFHNPLTSVVAMVVFMGYGRIRMIVVQAKMLAETHTYKATLLSSLNFVSQLIQIGVATCFGWLVTTQGLPRGHFLFGLSTFVVLFVLWLLTIMRPARGSRNA